MTCVSLRLHDVVEVSHRDLPHHRSSLLGNLPTQSRLSSPFNEKDVRIRPLAARSGTTRGSRVLVTVCVIRRIRATIMVAGFAASSALIVGTPMVKNTRMSSPMMANVADTLSTIQGPDLYWEEIGPLQDPPKEESDFKEYDTFSTFLAACAQHGVDLSQPDITVFAPGNVACEQFSAVNGPMTKDVCAYHVVKGVVSTDGLSGSPLTTLQGSTITYRRMFRKDFVDNAFCAAAAAPPRTSYAGNVKADNGVIHMINEVIYPGWSESSGGYGSE